MYFEFEVSAQFQNGDIKIGNGLFWILSLEGKLISCKCEAMGMYASVHGGWEDTEFKT